MAVNVANEAGNSNRETARNATVRDARGGLAVGVTNKLAWKIYAGVIGAVTTIVAHKLVSVAWKTVTGNEPPSPTDPETPVGSAISWVVASGIGVGVAQLFAQRYAARHWSTDTGLDAPEGTVKIKVD
jgi:hypothetical protein